MSNTDDHIVDVLNKLIPRLQEAGADAVQIHVTWVDENGLTHTRHHGLGNWNARRGMAQQFIEEDSARNNCQVEYTEYREEGDDV